MSAANWHTFQVLTKRAERLSQLLTTKRRFAAEQPHIWWGVSVENKKHGVPRIDQLRAAPAAIRFLSVEPLLEDVGVINLDKISWVSSRRRKWQWRQTYEERMGSVHQRPMREKSRVVLQAVGRSPQIRRGSNARRQDLRPVPTSCLAPSSGNIPMRRDGQSGRSHALV
jgi:protein gp37